MLAFWPATVTAFHERRRTVYEFQKRLDTAYRELQAAQKQLNAEISSYPAPISGCDAQFNFLLAERSKISQAIEVLNADVFVPTSRQPLHPHELARQ